MALAYWLAEQSAGLLAKLVAVSALPVKFPVTLPVKFPEPVVKEIELVLSVVPQAVVKVSKDDVALAKVFRADQVLAVVVPKASPKAEPVKVIG
jgi:hypothetical protein